MCDLTATRSPGKSATRLRLFNFLELKKFCRTPLLSPVLPPSDGDQKTGNNSPATEQRKRTGAPMLAKRFIVAAFAVLAVGMSSLAFSGPKDLFVDLEPIPSVIASN